MAEASQVPDGECELAAGSDVAFDISCTPCDSGGDVREADAYCTECNEYLCAACLKCHTNMSATNSHTLLDKNKMPATLNRADTSQPAIDNSTQPCKIHKDEIIKYYCPTHKLLGCSVCMIPDHDSCKGKIYIPNKAKNLTKTKEFKSCNSLITTLTKRSENVLKISNTNVKLTTEYCIKAKEELETFRQDMNAALDKLKLEIEEHIKEIAALDETAMRSVEAQANQVLTELQTMSATFKTLVSKTQHSQLFIEMTNAESRLADLQKQLDKLKVDFISTIQFEPSKELKELMAKKNALGELIVQKQNAISARHVADIEVTSPGDVEMWRRSCSILLIPEDTPDIEVKSPGDVQMWWISGASLLSKDRLVATEWINHAVKLFDTGRKKVIAKYHTETAPCDVTRINNTQVAVTLTKAKKILFMRSTDELVLEKEIRAYGSCAFIDYVDEKLIVSFIDPSEIRILSMTGEVLKTFANSSTGEPLFSRAPFVTYSHFKNAIYASDRENNRMFMLDMDGNVLAEYRDDDLDNPTGIAVDDMGMVYVCSNISNNVHLLTPDCRKVKIILTERDGIKEPWGACSYCRDTRRLYVGLHTGEYVKVFQLG